MEVFKKRQCNFQCPAYAETAAQQENNRLVERMSASGIPLEETYGYTGTCSAKTIDVTPGAECGIGKITFTLWLASYNQNPEKPSA